MNSEVNFISTRLGIKMLVLFRFRIDDKVQVWNLPKMPYHIEKYLNWAIHMRFFGKIGNMLLVFRVAHHPSIRNRNRAKMFLHLF